MSKIIACPSCMRSQSHRVGCMDCFNLQREPQQRLERIATAVLAGFCGNAAPNPRAEPDAKWAAGLAAHAVHQARAIIDALDQEPAP